MTTPNNPLLIAFATEGRRNSTTNDWHVITRVMDTIARYNAAVAEANTLNARLGWTKYRVRKMEG